MSITRLAAVVGISGGGPTAVAVAARRSGLVERIILESAVGPVPWPDRWIRVGSRLPFVAGTERVTWSAVRAFPETGLRRAGHLSATGSGPSRTSRSR